MNTKQIKARENLLDWAVMHAPSGANLDDWLAAHHIKSLVDAAKWEAALAEAQEVKP